MEVLEENHGSHFFFYLFERQFSSQLLPEEHHPRYPEENDVMSGFKESSGIEQLEILSLVRPPENGEGKQSRAKPRVQHVFVLLQLDL